MTAKQIALDAINAMPSGASFNRGKSKQDFATPKDFRDAVVAKFGFPSFDLAASATNYFASSDSEYFGVEHNSLTKDWSEFLGLLWLNCPFGNIAPWANKCYQESKKGAHILFLIPASVGSNYWAEFVHDKSRVYFLRPRLCFDGENGFPKDIVLIEYGPQVHFGYECWRWK